MLPQVFGDRWEIEEDLGEGGQAHTFLVKDLADVDGPRRVLKRLKNVNRIERFKQEIEALEQADHENVLRLIAYDFDAERPYLVTEYCRGGSLREARRFWRDSPPAAFQIFGEVLAGVSHAHSCGAIHRDLKPDNIFLRTDEGPAVVGDFGICLLSDLGMRATGTSEAVGPRLYMAPELEDGRLEDVRPIVDVYSLGKLLYWLLAGREFSREKHRDPDWDLRGPDPTGLERDDDVYMEHINRLLDRMIVEDPDSRWSLPKVRGIFNVVRRLYERRHYPLAEDLSLPCNFCGIGTYQKKGNGNINHVRSMGLNPVGASEWRILVCNECGHVQHFRLDLADDGWYTPPDR